MPIEEPLLNFELCEGLTSNELEFTDKMAPPLLAILFYYKDGDGDASLPFIFVVS